MSFRISPSMHECCYILLTVPAIQSNLSKEQTVSKPKYVHFLTRSTGFVKETVLVREGTSAPSIMVMPRV